MIIKNGTIEVVSTSGGGIDENGYPKSTTTSYGDPIDCQYIPKSVNYLSIVKGEHYRSLSFSILIESIVGGFVANRVRLKDLEGVEIGEFDVRSVEALSAMCEIKIEV